MGKEDGLVAMDRENDRVGTEDADHAVVAAVEMLKEVEESLDPHKYTTFKVDEEIQALQAASLPEKEQEFLENNLTLWGKVTYGSFTGIISLANIPENILKYESAAAYVKRMRGV